MIGRLSLAQIRTMLILFAARGCVYKSSQQMGQELVAEVFLNVELRLCCDRLNIIDHAYDSVSGSEQYSIADFGIKICI